MKVGGENIVGGGNMVDTNRCFPFYKDLRNGINSPWWSKSGSILWTIGEFFTWSKFEFSPNLGQYRILRSQKSIHAKKCAQIWQSAKNISRFGFLTFSSRLVYGDFVQ